MVNLSLVLGCLLAGPAFSFTNFNQRITSLQRRRTFPRENYLLLKPSKFKRLTPGLCSGNMKLFSSEVTNDLGFAYGGDFAGHSATYNADTGKLIRVPEHLVPESMIEWGNIPGCLETIISENVQNNEISTNLQMDRFTLSILPEVGCGVDNLETTLQKSSIDVEENFSASIFSKEDVEIGISSFHHDVYTGTTPSKTDKRKVMHETCFHYQDHNNEDDDYGKKVLRRVRVQIELVFDFSQKSEDRCKIFGPIRVLYERKTSQISTNGEIAKGGGLDGRTVTRLIGSKQANRHFTDSKDGTLNEQHYIGLWKKTFLENDEKERVEYKTSDFKKSLYLPLGLMIQRTYHESSDTLNLIVSKTETGNNIEDFKRFLCTKTFSLSRGNVAVNSKHWVEERIS